MYIPRKKTAHYWWSKINVIIKYSKAINLLDITLNQSSKFRTKNWVEVNDDDRCGANKTKVKFKATILKSSLCDCSDAYILVKRTITTTVAEEAGDEAARQTGKRTDKGDKEVTFKSSAPFTYKNKKNK